MAACVVPLRVVLTAMILVVAVIAAAVSFAPLYTASLSSATDSGQAFSASISREIVSTVSHNFAVMQSAATAMVTAAYLGGWDESDPPGIKKWMSYGVTLGADSLNIIFDDYCIVDRRAHCTQRVNSSFWHVCSGEVQREHR